MNKILEYFKDITVEDLVEKGFISAENVVKNEYGYFIFEGCKFSNSEKFNVIFLPSGGRLFSMLTCSNSGDEACEEDMLRQLDSEVLFDGDYSLEDIRNADAIDDFNNVKSKLINRVNILDGTIISFLQHLPKYGSCRYNRLIVHLIEKFNIDIPAEVIKDFFLEWC